MNSARTTYYAILLGTLMWCTAFIAAPFLGSAMPSETNFLYRFFRLVCHQIEERSFHLFVGPMAVCSRCCAIYLAFLAGVLLYPMIRPLLRPKLPDRSLLIGALLPMLFDVGAGFVGIHDITNLTRLLSGIPFGFVAAQFLIPATISAIPQKRISTPHTKP